MSVVVPEKWLAVYQELLSRRSDQPPLFVGSKKLLERMAGFPMYQGIMAVGRTPVPRSLDSILSAAARPWLLVAADGLTNAQNMGALARNCAAFGATALLTGETCCSPFIRRAVASSAGTVFRLPVIESADLRATLVELRARGVRCVAAHPHAVPRPLSQTGLSGGCCVVFGSEGEGITPAVLAQCDECAAIPMPPTVDSLNVASATAVFLYEARRQRESQIRGPGPE
jgi:TrmH family RNA methyltransferase